MDVLLSPSSPMPAWASTCHASLKVRKVCRPNPTQFKRFVQALGTRYSGSYADENEGGGVLPRVARWSIWNEPNQGGWLQPQADEGAARSPRCSTASWCARRSSACARPAMAPTRSCSARPRRSAAARARPPAGRRRRATFLRDVLCIDSRGRALRRRSLDCSGGFAGRLPVTGIAHHPYTRGGSQPPTSKGSSTRDHDQLDLAPEDDPAPGRAPSGGSRATCRSSTRSSASRRTRPTGCSACRWPSRPPGSTSRTSSPGTIRACAPSPSTRCATRRRCRPSRRGLRFNDGRAKPSWAAYRLPLWVATRGSKLLVWGQLRPAADGAVEQVDIQNAADARTARSRASGRSR